MRAMLYVAVFVEKTTAGHLEAAPFASDRVQSSGVLHRSGSTFLHGTTVADAHDNGCPQATDVFLKLLH